MSPFYFREVLQIGLRLLYQKLRVFLLPIRQFYLCLLTEPKITEFNVSLVIYENVIWLQIPMNVTHLVHRLYR